MLPRRNGVTSAMQSHAAVVLVVLAACGPTTTPDDAMAPSDTPSAPIDAPAIDAPRIVPDAPTDEVLSEHRDRLLTTLGEPCATWSAMNESERAVFTTITHRLFSSRAPDGSTLLSHVTRTHAVLGGGSSGTTCGGVENNRVFLSTDAALHGWLVETWNEDGTPLADDGGSTWIHTRDAAGPHDPFDASVETDTGLRCTLIFEDDDSRPPTAQAHFFEGAPVAFTRGDASLPSDPFMLEIDHDYNCVHDSNPTCRDFLDRYRTNHGDFECQWVPSVCTAVGTGCHRDVES